MSRVATWLLLLTALLLAGAIATGLLLGEEFRLLLEKGSGAAPAFEASRPVRIHALLGHAAAAVALPMAAAGLLLGLHGLLVSGGSRWSALLVGLGAPLLFFGLLGAVYSGHGSWEPTRMGELQESLLSAFWRGHGLRFAWLTGVGVVLLGLALAWLRRAEGDREADEDED